MLSAFTLVIVLGICGMLGFIGLAVSGVWQPEPFRQVYSETQLAYGEILGDYYVANGNSWRGVERRLDTAPFSFGRGRDQFVIVDEAGRIVVGADVELRSRKTPLSQEHGVTIEANGRAVGTLITRSEGPFGRSDGAPIGVVLPIVRSFVLAGVLLAGGLLLLAVLLSRWLSRPVRGVTDAALRVASGSLDVQVDGARIRELDELAQAFNAMARSLANADRQRRQMTADIAHELRTPLSIVKGRLEGLQDGIYQATPEQVGQLLDETSLLERLIEDLRVLALAEAGQLPLYPEPTDPADLLAGVVASFAKQAADQHVVLSIDAPDDLPFVNVDPQRMQQVLSNVVANALRYTPPGGAVRLCADARDRVVRVCVEDTGPGISAEDLPHIFDRFWRADRARTRGAGSGLGLAIAKQIVLSHNGDISAMSVQGRGTAVTITLPVE